MQNKTNSKKTADHIKFSVLSDTEQREIVANLRDFFIGREDAYAVQKVKEDGSQYYSSIPAPVTDEVLKLHLNGGQTVGVYQIDPSTCFVKWGVIDIDGEHIEDAKRKTMESWHRLRNTGLGSDYILVERSGSKDSFHIWIFFENDTRAEEAKSFLEGIARPIDPKIEVFPKQEGIKKDGFGNLVKLPLGFHKSAKSWTECFIKTGEGASAANFEALRVLKKCQLPRPLKLKTGGLRPCFKRAVVEQRVFEGPGGDDFRLALAAEMIASNYSDAEMHKVFALQPGYSKEKTQEKIEFTRRKRYKSWTCEKIKDRCAFFVADLCRNCARTGDSLEAEKTPGKKTEKKKEEPPTVEEILELEVYNSNGNITNIIPTQRVFNGAPCFFYLETMLEDGEIKTSLTHTRAIPVQTAPSLDFYKCNYNSLKDIYTELRKIIRDYIAFPTDSIAPDLIALGSVASYFREIYYTYPYFDFISSEPEAGKTTAMKVQTFTSFHGTIASSVTEALLFREIDGSHCFYGLDNIERLFASPKDYASIIDWLLSSYSRDIPCKRLEKTEEGYEVRYFDGYGIKAFTHIRDFPFALRALRSRCIQIVMETGKPKKFYPSAEKFTETRDKLYKARLWEFEAVKESYEDLITTNVLTGRTGDLYYPLLAIAKLVDGTLYTRVLKYAKRDEVERREFDGWNIALISLLLEKEMFGSNNTKDIREVYEYALKEKGLLKDSDPLSTRTVTTKLKKLGFTREDKKTDNKTWFSIDKEKLMLKAYEYDIISEDKKEDKKEEKSDDTHTPPKPNLPNLPNLLNFREDQAKDKEGSASHREEDKRGTEEIGNKVSEYGKELTKVGKLAKRGVCESTKNVCDGCGMNAQTTEYNGEWLCDKCLTDYADNLKGNVGIRPEAFDEDFQIKQDKEAADRLRAEK